MEIWISRRTLQILDYLLDVQESVNIARIASALCLSPAQVRYSLDQLEPWLAIKGLELVRKPRSGVRIHAPDAKKQALFNEIANINGQVLARSTDERRRLLVLQLLISTGPLHQDEISDWLKISRPTLFRDIAFARTWIEQHGLSFSNHRRQGFFTTGREILWRETVLDLLISGLDQNLVITRCAKSVEETEPGLPVGFLGDMAIFLDVLPLKRAEMLVTAIERKIHIHLEDDRRLHLILCLGLSIYRMGLGKIIPEEEYGSVPDLPPEVEEAAAETKHLLTAWFQKAVPPGEVLYIIECIQNGIASESRPGIDRDTAKVSQSGVCSDVAAELVRASAHFLHPGLLHDSDFSECLALVLEQAAGRRSLGDRSETKPLNPAREEKDPLSRFTRRQLAPLLISLGWKPSQSLLDAIAVHLGTALERQRYGASLRKVWVVCGAGLATARNLVSRLNMHLPELKILGIASTFEILHNPAMTREADAVISTVKLTLDDVPLIHVSALGTAEDMARIRRMLGLGQTAQPTHLAREQNPGGISLAELLREETIAIVDEAGSWGEVIELAGGLLQKVGAIWPSYIAAIKDMIVLYGPYMVIAPGLALLHAGPEMGAKRLAVSLVLLRKPVAFGHTAFDPVNIAMAFASVDHTSHLQTVGEIMSLAGDEAWRAKIMRSKTKADIIVNVLAGLK